MDKFVACVVKPRMLKSWSNSWIGLTIPRLKEASQGFEGGSLFGALFSRQKYRSPIPPNLFVSATSQQRVTKRVAAGNVWLSHTGSVSAPLLADYEPKELQYEV